MATITSTTNGNWSSGSTWVGGVAPGNGDTAVISHNVTVDVNTTIGTSPNDSTTAVISLGARILTIAAGVTLTCRGNQSWTNGASLVLGTGSQLVFDNSSSGGSPVYRIIGSGIYALSAVGTSGSPCGISAISGQSWEFFNGSARYIAWSSLTATYCTFTRNAVGSAGGFQVFSGTSAFSNCTFDGGGTTLFFSTGASVSLTVDNCLWQNGNYSVNGAVRLELATAATSGTRRFNGNVLDNVFTYISKGFTIQGNYFRGLTPVANSAYTWASFRLNFVHGTGNENGGNGQIVLNNVIRNYWVIDGANPHFISATALQTSTNTLIAQNVFESQGTDTVDTGDCVILNSGATAGTNRILVRNNITVPAPAGQQTGQLLTIYNNNTSVSEHERNTVNVNDTSIVGVGKRAAFAFAEASNGAAGQIAVLKGNLVHGTSASQGFIAERIQGTVNDIITASGANYNWRFNTSDGDNGRGYTDRGGNNNLWAAGNATAAGVDNNQGSGDPAFVAVTRTSVSWAVARGYGSTFADVVAAIKAVPSRTVDLINYIFEGNKPTSAACRNAAHDGACVGAANWHDSSRDLTTVTTVVSELSASWLA